MTTLEVAENSVTVEFRSVTLQVPLALCTRVEYSPGGQVWSAPNTGR
ncbi:MAG TPA: hypothetical protein VII33_16125 [Nakamurella sp.]